MLTSRGLSSDSKCVLKAEPGKLDIKRREPGILFISLPIVNHSSNKRLWRNFLFLYWFSVISDVIKKSATSSRPDKGNMPWDRKRLLGYVETIQLILGVTDKSDYSRRLWLRPFHIHTETEPKPNRKIKMGAFTYAPKPKPNRNRTPNRKRARIWFYFFRFRWPNFSKHDR